jgi:hypothetical protein
LSDPACEPVRQRLDQLADGVLDAPWAERLQSHLADCPACATAWADIQTVRRSLGALPPEVLPAGFRQRLARRLAVAPGPRRLNWRGALPPLAAAAAGFVLAAALAVQAVPGVAPARAGAVRAAGGAAPAVAIPRVLPLAGPARGLVPAPLPARPGFSADVGATVPASGSAAAAAVPLAVTLLAVHPVQALAAARLRVAAAGGELAETLAPALPGSDADPRLAGTLDAVLPRAAALGLLVALRREGTVLSTVGADAYRTSPSAWTRVLLSVFVRVPAVTRPQPRPTAALRTSFAGMRRLALELLRAAAVAAPWAGLAGAVLLLGWSVVWVGRWASRP